jgi:hypothetical protein
MTRKAHVSKVLLPTIKKMFFLLAVLIIAAVPLALRAQTAGEGAITGTVRDSTGAAIPNATVTAINTATNVSTERTSSGSGAFTISPIPPGVYALAVSAKGFKSLHQDNLTVDALGVLGFDPVLTLGEATETVEVTAAPPVLDTANATVGLVVENSTYAALPLQMNNGARDATSFASLAPGTQAGARTPIVGGTGNYLGQLYIDGMPAETINQQGDNRLVSQGFDLDAVDQFQVVTSTPPAEYSGAGASNYTMKSGGNKYHGQVADYIRNTVFDTWNFTSKAATVTNALGVKSPAPKPAEHQNELSATIGGHVPKTADKLFFFFAYDRFHSRRGASPTLFTIPTTQMNMGDFTELNGNVGTGGFTGIAGDPSDGGLNKPLIYDPTSNACVGNVCTRTPFQGVKNGIPTYNVIPTSYLSPIALKMASYLPAPSNPNALANNYLGGYPSGFDNHVFDWRVDFDLSAKQRISTVGAMGAVHYVQNYNSGGTGSGAYGLLPIPYVAGTVANIFPKFYDVEDVYTINDRLVNQLKYAYTRFIQPQIAATDGIAQYSPAALGITNVPMGAASTNFPGASFGQTGAVTTTLTGWTQQGAAGATQKVTPETSTALDNLQWVKGPHTITFGFTFEWQQTNVAAPIGYSGLVELPYNSNSTAQYTANANTLSAASGNSYASFLLGAVGGSPSLQLQPVSELGGRYHLAAPYVDDNWKVNDKITLSLGIRWDLFTPYHEVKDRWTFLNPSLTNAATGTPGMLQFAGNYGGAGVSCGCRTPVSTYYKNIGPRLGVVFAPNVKTIFRGGIAEVFSQAGGVGGRGGAYQGTGQTGFNVTANASPELTSGMNAGPSFYLNTGSTFTTKGLANSDLFGKGFSYPANPTPNVAAQTLQTGNYLNSSGGLVTAGGVSFADFYLSGRAPEFTFYNFGIERSITNDMTLSVNYVGDESHFLNTGGNARGYWANQLDPAYLAALGPLVDSTGKKPLLIAAATPANVAIAQGKMANIAIPAFYQAAANANPTSSTLTIAQGLTAFPQYSSVTDLWGGNSANLAYQSLQIMLLQRQSHGLTFNINYTYSKNIGDDGTFRSGFNIPAAALSGGGQAWHQDRIERSWTTVSAPQVLHAFGVYSLPFGKGHIGSDSMLVRALAGGWLISGIYTYGSGTPVAVISSQCSGTTSPLQGQCMPDVVPGVTNARINGSYGTGPNGITNANLGNVKYFDATAFKTQTNVSSIAGSPIYLLGNAPRTQPINLRNPGQQNLDAALRRSFPLPKDIGSFVFEVDCLNVWNKTQFSGPGATYGASSFGQITGVANTPRDFQFAGHINF